MGRDQIEVAPQTVVEIDAYRRRMTVMHQLIDGLVGDGLDVLSAVKAMRQLADDLERLIARLELLFSPFQGLLGPLPVGDGFLKASHNQVGKDAGDQEEKSDCGDFHPVRTVRRWRGGHEGSHPDCGSGHHSDGDHGNGMPSLEEHGSQEHSCGKEDHPDVVNALTVAYRTDRHDEVPDGTEVSGNAGAPAAMSDG